MNPFRRTEYRSERDYEYGKGHKKRGNPYETDRRRHHKGGHRSRETHEDHVAAGYKAALSNPNTTRRGREHAKHELRLMGRDRDAHVPFITKVKRALGIRNTPRRQRRAELNRRRY